jgi:hypothetical protein
MLWEYLTATISNAGSGYIEQPTITFTGTNTIVAAAYATVGGATSIKGLGGTIELQTAQGRGFLVYESGTVPVNYWSVRGGAVNANPVLYAQGSDTNVSGAITTKGTGQLSFQTNGAAQTQFVVAHTASAVNYVQVTGSATGSTVQVTAQGSDSVVGLQFVSKSASIIFVTRSGNARSFNILDSSLPVNYLQVQGNTAGVAPILSAQGTDTNIDLALTPKGTGVVTFGTYTAGVLTPTGYVTIKDSGGTTRRLLVG